MCVYKVSFRMSNPTHLLSDSLLSFFSSVTHDSLHLFPVLFCSPSPHSCTLLSSVHLQIFSPSPTSSSFSISEQPVDHSLPVTWLLPDQQLCIQLPAAVAPQPNNEPGKWCLPPMVRLSHTVIHAHTSVQGTMYTCILYQ